MRRIEDTDQHATDRRNRLVLFLSNGGSLSKWRAEGIFSREWLLYREFLRRGYFDEVVVFSYDHADREIPDLPAGTIVLAPPAAVGRVRGVVAGLYGIGAVIANRSVLRRATWYKTNQMSGALPALTARMLLHRQLMVRTGYTLSRRLRLNGQMARAAVAKMLESVAYFMADRIVVTSREAAADLNNLGKRVSLSPSYIDMTRFLPKVSYSFDEPVVYVGRLEPQKNLENLVRACAAIGRPLHLIGIGSQRDALALLAKEVGANLHLLGQHDNDQIAAMLPRYSLFALSSFHEGLPKSLIEAMACGMVCVASDIPGVSDLIVDGSTGYLIRGFDPDSIAAALSRAYSERRAEIGLAARRHVENDFSLDNYISREAALFGLAA